MAETQQFMSTPPQNEDILSRASSNVLVVNSSQYNSASPVLSTSNSGKRKFEEVFNEPTSPSAYGPTEFDDNSSPSKRTRYNYGQHSPSSPTQLYSSITREEIYQKLCLLMQKAFHLSPDKLSVVQCDFQSFLRIFSSNHTMYPDYAPEGRLTLLYIASVYGQHEILEYLLEKRANHNVIFKEHFTPVHVCARSGYVRCLELLLKYGADYKAETTIGNRAIHIAATYGHLECIKVLVKHGEHIDNNFTRNGVTPLQCAITHDRVEVLQWLLDNGANPLIGRFEMDQILMAYAEDKLSEDHFKQILPIHVACRFNSVKCLKVLIEYGIDINLRDEKQRTPLHTACLFNSDAAIEMLLRNKCDPNMKDKQGAQPLHILFSLDSDKNFFTVAKAAKLEERHLIHIWHHTQHQYKPRIANVIQQIVRSE